MSNPILPSTIRDDFVTRIKAIVPAETRHANKPWRYTQSVEDVPGAEIRTFSLRLKGRGDGVTIGCGNDYQFDALLYVSYHGLQHHDADPLIVEDHRQLFQTLALRAGALDGLHAVIWDGPWEYDSEEEGSVWGHHRFIVRYIANADP